MPSVLLKGIEAGKTIGKLSAFQGSKETSRPNHMREYKAQGKESTEAEVILRSSKVKELVAATRATLGIVRLEGLGIALVVETMSSLCH